jgi:hypothetical protein
MAGKTSGEIVIRIKNETKSDNKTEIVNEEYNESSVNEFSNALKNIVHNEAFQYVKQVAINEARYEVNKDFAMRDDYIGQRDINISLGVISKVYSIGTSVVSGAIMGGAIGASVALAGSLLVEGIQVYQNLDQQNIKIAQLNSQLDYNRIRAGYSLTSGSIGENK